MFVNRSVGGSYTDGASVALESNHHCSWKTNGKNEALSCSLLHPLLPNWLSWQEGFYDVRKPSSMMTGQRKRKHYQPQCPKSHQTKWGGAGETMRSDLGSDFSTLKRGSSGGT